MGRVDTGPAFPRGRHIDVRGHWRGCASLAFCCALFAAGCAEGGIPASLHIPQGTATQQVVELRATQETQRLVEELARVGSHGFVEGLSEGETTARIEALVAQIARALTAEVRTSLQGLGPAMREMTADLTTSALRTASAELSRTLGPALRQLIVEELLRQPDFQLALADTTRQLSKQAVLGSDEGLKALEAKRERSPLGDAAKLLSSNAWLVGLGLLVLIGLPFLLLLRQRGKGRAQQLEAERRTEIAAAILRNAHVGDDAALQRLLSAVADTLSPPRARTSARASRDRVEREPKPAAA